MLAMVGQTLMDGGIKHKHTCGPFLSLTGLLHYTMFVELHGVPHTLSNAVFCQAQHVERAITQYLQKLDTFDTDIEVNYCGVVLCGHTREKHVV